MYRKNKGMTQGELANGIVSVSYLSKIETGQIIASEEVIVLLTNKLGIVLDDFSEEHHTKACRNWFHQFLLIPSETTNTIMDTNEIRNIEKETKNKDLKTLINIHFINYYLIKKEISAAEKQIKKMQKISSVFNNEQNYYFYKFMGNFCWKKGKNKESLNHYLKALEFSLYLDQDVLEKADLHYILGLAYSKARKPVSAIEYTEKALAQYKEQYFLKRCGQCHITLGISYRRTYKYPEAERHYHAALRLSDIIDDLNLRNLAHLNLAYLYSSTSQSEKAIAQYLKCFGKKGSFVTSDIIPITQFVKALHKAERYEDALQWIQVALRVARESENITIRMNILELQVYQCLIEQTDDVLENKLSEELIPLLRKEEEYAELANYSKILSDHYSRKFKYKQALHYERLATLAYSQMIDL